MAYVPVEVVEVLAWGERIGAVAYDPSARAYAFEYDRRWAATGVDPAPTVMPVRSRPYTFPTLPPATYFGLPPMLADALPDSFGTSVLTARLAREGVAATDITPLDRLAYMADRAMGALEFRPPRGPVTRVPTAVHVSDLVTASRGALTGSFDRDDEAHAALGQLLDVGTSAGGARAKAVVAWHPGTGEMRSGQLPADDGFAHWLLKLDGVGEANVLGTTTGWGRVEYAYSLMAQAAGLTMSDTHLLEENGRAHFMTRRFDRRGPGGREKVHVATLCALGPLDFRAIGVHDYAQLFEVIDALGLGPDTRREAFRRMAFNVVAANCDDHTKNVSFTMDRDGRWALAPAYDLVWAHDPTSRWTRAHLMAVDGRFADIERADVMAVADRFVVPHAAATLDEVVAAVDRWDEWAAAAALPDETTTHIADDLARVRTTLLA